MISATLPASQVPCNGIFWSLKECFDFASGVSSSPNSIICDVTLSKSLSLFELFIFNLHIEVNICFNISQDYSEIKWPNSYESY